MFFTIITLNFRLYRPGSRHRWGSGRVGRSPTILVIEVDWTLRDLRVTRQRRDLSFCLFALMTSFRISSSHKPYGSLASIENKGFIRQETRRHRNPTRHITNRNRCSTEGQIRQMTVEVELNVLPWSNPRLLIILRSDNYLKVTKTLILKYHKTYRF